MEASEARRKLAELARQAVRKFGDDTTRAKAWISQQVDLNPGMNKALVYAEVDDTIKLLFSLREEAERMREVPPSPEKE